MGKMATATANGIASNWQFGPAEGTATEIATWQTRVYGSGSCSHALRAVSEMAIDVSACGRIPSPATRTASPTKIAQAGALKKSNPKHPQCDSVL